MQGMEICLATQHAFHHAIGSRRIADEMLTSIIHHADAVVLREEHQGMPWANIAAWPSKQTRRDLPRDIRLSCAVNRNRAADMANDILFGLITEGKA